MSAERYEQLLFQVLQPDTETVRTAVQELNKLLKHSSSIPFLAHVLFNSQNEGIRQLAAVMMRKRLVGHWGKLAEDFQTQFRESILQRVLSEPSSLVRKSIGEVVGLLARLIVPLGQWNSLLPFLFQLTQSPQAEHREISMRLFCSLSEHIPEQLKPHIATIHRLFLSGLSDSSPNVSLATLKGIGAFLELLESETSLIEALFPPMKRVLEYCIQNNLSESVYAALETLDGLIELHYLPDNCAIEVLNMILTIGNNPSLDRELRRRSLTLIDTYVVTSPKLVTDYCLVSGILSVLFAICAEPPSTEEEEEEDPTELPNFKFAAQLLDSLSTSIPTKFVYQPVMQQVGIYLPSDDPYRRRAALVALAVIVEGCSLSMEEHLEEHLKLIFPYFKDPNHIVREHACLALAQFSSHLQPDIAKYHNQVLPLLFDSLNDPSVQVKTQTCYALEMFVEHLDTDIVPYLEPLMNRLVELLKVSNPSVQSNIITVISSTATAAGPIFEPYFPGVLGILEGFLHITDENHMSLRCAATECVGVIISSLAEKTPKEVIGTMMQISMGGLQLNVPELKEYTFLFFANVAPIMKREFSVYLPTLVPIIFASCESDEGIIESDDRKQEIEGLEEDSDDEEGDLNLSVKTSFLDEKTAAARALGEIAKATGPDFLPYVEKTVSVLEFLITYFHEDIRQAAATSFSQLIAGVHDAFPPPLPWVRGQVRGLQPNVQALVRNAMSYLLNSLSQEAEKQAVSNSCMAIVELLKLLGPDLSTEFLEPLTQGVHYILTKQSACFQVVEEYDDEDEEGEVVLGLFDSSCEILVECAKSCDQQIFMTQFENIYSALTKYLKPSIPPTYQAVFIGAIAEMTNVIQAGIQPHAKQLLTYTLKGMTSKNSVLRRNTTFATGLLVLYGAQETQQMIPQALEAVQQLLEDDQPDVLDNACGALARLIFASPFSIPPQFPVVSVLLNKLPLREDMEPYIPILHAFARLVRERSPMIKDHIPNVLYTYCSVAENSEVDEKLRAEIKAVMIKELVEVVGRDGVISILGSWPEEMRKTLEGLI